MTPVEPEQEYEAVSTGEVTKIYVSKFCIKIKKNLYNILQKEMIRIFDYIPNLL